MLLTTYQQGFVIFLLFVNIIISVVKYSVENCGATSSLVNNNDTK